MRSTGTAFVALALLAPPAPCPAQAPSGSDAWFDSDGVRIRYVMRGNGPPVLLVHGFSITTDLNWVWPGIVDSLATQFTVIAPDLRGHGRSDKPHQPEAYGIQMVNDLVRLLDHLGIRQARVVGYSMGGALALKLLTTHPERVAGVVMGGAGWRAPEDGPPDFLPVWLDGLDRAARLGTPVADVIRLPGVPPYAPEIVSALNANDPRALAAVIRGGGGIAVTESELRAVRVPVAAVVGEADAFARAEVERLRGVLPAVEVTVLPGADHASAIGHPGFRQAIARFAHGR
jgi:pimeloyl-ACP methyl ester carboxylesterase